MTYIATIYHQGTKYEIKVSDLPKADKNKVKRVIKIHGKSERLIQL